MKDFLNDIRKPTQMPRSRKILYSSLIFMLGVILGTISKLLDETASNLLPYFLEQLDLRNFFSRMGIWLFLAVVIAIYSKSPIRSALNVLIFFVGMVGSYYLYTVLIAGFYPKTYMMIWIAMTLISPLLAFICWYAKGRGVIATLISSFIIVAISRQAFAFGFWYFNIKYSLEFLVWIATIVVLYQSPKQISKVLVIGMLLYFATAQLNIFWGML
ncbi:DUF6518 family protein [Amphibacillus xylanus]|uniref:Uncharacterized protein n=2 Tax=Bacilli TaxID=91061 RepID=K0IZU8_AMPXN|nr:DUF6518 family protein [Amphibacillus xylanus]BAM48059.1 hypothetical protein AXY_19270 [Amphibacillus xylanus NBRC 15112]